MKPLLLNHLKNILGKRTKRKLVVFSVDDYGNVRVDSRGALEQLHKEGVHPNGRFDEWDSLETTQDLEQLFDTLSSVRDNNGRHAVFTPYALPCNIDFEATLKTGAYVPEALPATWNRLQQEQPQAYHRVDELWNQGISAGIFIPQFHGREHLNLNLFNHLLTDRNLVLLQNLQHKCLIALPGHKDLPGIGFTQAFSFWKEEETEAHKSIIEDGLKKFKEVFGMDTTVFTPPAQQLHPGLYSFVEAQGVHAIDKPFLKKRHLGLGHYQREWNTLGQRSGHQHITIVRNVVFEPNNGVKDHVGQALKQIEAAFTWGKPANISSHRVNFCGHIDPKNRENSLKALRQLLQSILKKWPDTEFISAPDLVEILEYG